VTLKSDIEPPIVTVNPSSAEVCKNKEITITLTDNESGLKSDEGTYYLSTSRTNNDKAHDGKYTSGQPFTIGTDSEGIPLTGTYYLWVGDVEDNAGNKNLEHYVGEFVFDNSAPTIDFGIKSSTTSTITVETIAVDKGTAGIKSYKYYISQTKGTIGTLVNEQNVTSEKTTYTYQGLTLGNTYYVTVIVTDSVGNESISNSSMIKLVDNYMITAAGINPIYKTTLADAVSAVSRNESRITVIKSCVDTSEVNIQNLNNLTIDLNGNTLQRKDTLLTIGLNSSVNVVGKGYIVADIVEDNSVTEPIVNSGTFNISCENESGIQFKAMHGIGNWGILNINSGILEYDAIMKEGVVINNYNTININGGKIKSVDRRNNNYR